YGQSNRLIYAYLVIIQQLIVNDNTSTNGWISHLTRITSMSLQIPIDLIQTKLVSGLLPYLGHRVDIFYMNPLLRHHAVGRHPLAVHRGVMGGRCGREGESPLIPRRLLPSRSQRQPAAGGLRDYGVEARNARRSRDAEAGREGEARHTQVPEVMVRRIRDGVGG
ncbi:hypothetical protein BC936DRAFT_139524, partial [Jimgerdemannia flammicorona]